MAAGVRFLPLLVVVLVALAAAGFMYAAPKETPAAKRVPLGCGLGCAIVLVPLLLLIVPPPLHASLIPMRNVRVDLSVPGRQPPVIPAMVTITTISG